MMGDAGDKETGQVRRRSFDERDRRRETDSFQDVVKTY